MIKCKICGAECNSVSHHLKVHKVSVSKYLEMFPGSELKTKEVFESYSNAATKKYYETDQTAFREACKVSANSDANKERLRNHNKDPKFIDSQRERLSKQMSETNRREWGKDYDSCKKRALKNLLWDASRGSRSKVQKIVASYVRSLGFLIKEEKPIFVDGSVVHIDIYLEDFNLAIEVNGRYWHGDPSIQSVNDMTSYQKQGYERDLIKKSHFKDKILFIWEDQVYNDDYKNIIDKFLIEREVM